MPTAAHAHRGGRGWQPEMGWPGCTDNRGAALDGMVAAVCRWNDVQLCLSLSFLSRSFFSEFLRRKGKR